jgi:hypothetical protein
MSRARILRHRLGRWLRQPARNPIGVEGLPPSDWAKFFVY